jgi:hypothetical protein
LEIVKYHEFSTVDVSFNPRFAQRSSSFHFLKPFNWFGCTALTFA